MFWGLAAPKSSHPLSEFTREGLCRQRVPSYGLVWYRQVIFCLEVRQTGSSSPPETAPSHHNTEGIVEERTGKRQHFFKINAIWGIWSVPSSPRWHHGDVAAVIFPKFDIIIKNLPQHIILYSPAPKKLRMNPSLLSRKKTEILLQWCNPLTQISLKKKIVLKD